MLMDVLGIFTEGVAQCASVLACQLPIREIAGSNPAVGQSDIGFSSLSLYRQANAGLVGMLRHGLYSLLRAKSPRPPKKRK